MQLARFLNKLFKNGGFILIDANSNNYIIGSPDSDKPIKVKILDKKLHHKLLFHPDLYLGEAYTDGKIVRTWKSQHLTPVVELSFDPTTTLVASGGTDGTLKIWDIVRQYCTHNLKGGSGVYRLLFIFISHFTLYLY